MRLLGTAAFLLFSLLLQAEAQPSSEPVVRVRVLDRVDLGRITLEAVGSDGALTVDGVPIRAALQGERVEVRRDGRGVRITVAGEEHTGREIVFAATEIRVRSGRTDRRYPARLGITVEEGAVKLVNHAPMDTYVASVVASELNFPEIEAAKAQAVLARTYARRRSGQHASYDLVDDQRAQVYRGLSTITQTSRRAAQETSGQTLTYNGALADAYYFSSSGGHTADNESIWTGTPIPYLRGVPDPYDTVSPDHAWRTTASKDAVLRTLSSRYGGSVRGVRIDRRSPKGRVLAVRLDGANRETITGSQFRRAVNAAVGARTVRSTQYRVEVQGDLYVFTGGGFGHGVGMSQFGALGQARAGRSYREILAHYFVGTDVSGAGSALPAMVASTSPRAEPVSALRTRYRAPSGRRWPTQRRLVHTETEAPEAGTQAADIASQPSTPATPPARRRTAW